jgi:hypothetical protein
MYSRSRIALVIGVVAAAAALAATSALGGDAKRFKSTVTLAQSNPFHGHISSPKAACEISRTVNVYRAKYGSDDLYDSTKTGASNEWSIPATPNGNFYAQVTKRVGHKIICKADDSPTLHFGG